MARRHRSAFGALAVAFAVSTGAATLAAQATASRAGAAPRAWSVERTAHLWFSLRRMRTSA